MGGEMTCYLLLPDLRLKERFFILDFDMNESLSFFSTISSFLNSSRGPFHVSERYRESFPREVNGENLFALSGFWKPDLEK